MSDSISSKYQTLVSNVTNVCSRQKSITIELTPTNACNCNCKYCFEHDHSQRKIDYRLQNRQLQLLVKLCEEFDPAQFNRVNIVFWGGEPMLNLDFVQQVVRATCKYKFVYYMMYSNGTLVDKFKQFTNDPIVKSICHRFEVQLSYDGDKHHKAMRGDNSASIFETAHMLVDAGFSISFKATLVFDKIGFFVDSWKSYERLHDEFGSIARYCPTLDTMNVGLTSEIVDDFYRQSIEVAKCEYKFIAKYGYPLISWYDPYHMNRQSCRLDYHAAIDTDGSIYLCHGCFYSSSKQKFKLDHIDEISSLYDVLHEVFYNSRENEECKACGAFFCNICHVACVDSSNFIDDWQQCRSSNRLRCACFRAFSRAFTALTLALIDNNVLMQ